MIVCDMGGTSFDVSLVRDGYIKFTRETWLGGQFTGHMTGLSSVDVKNIGAGGGSIAWIDPGGLLRVGPQSAGARSGAGVLRRGGDAAHGHRRGAVLGYIDPDYFLGGADGAVGRCRARARSRAMSPSRSGMDVEDAAHAVLTIANEHMVGAIRDITINEGFDPRESLVVAGGGAGGMTIGRIAEELGCDRVLVPRTAGTLSRVRRAVLRHRRPSSASASAPTPTAFDLRVGQPRHWRAWPSRSRSSSLGCRRRRTRARASSSSRRATRTRSGSSRCRWRRADFDGAEDVEAMVEAFHASTSGSSRSASRASTSSASTGRDGRRRACPSRARTGRLSGRGARAGAGGVRRAWFGAHGSLETRCYSGRGDVRGPRARRPGDHRGADDDGGRLSGLGRHRHRPGRLPDEPNTDGAR